MKKERKAQVLGGRPARAITWSAWLEEKRSLYEANKDVRIMHEYCDPEKKTGVKAWCVYPGDPRYNDLKKGPFVQKYERCLELHEELAQLVSQMVQAGY